MTLPWFSTPTDIHTRIAGFHVTQTEGRLTLNKGLVACVEKRLSHQQFISLIMRFSQHRRGLYAKEKYFESSLGVESIPIYFDNALMSNFLNIYRPSHRSFHGSKFKFQFYMTVLFKYVAVLFQMKCSMMMARGKHENKALVCQLDFFFFFSVGYRLSASLLLTLHSR